MFRYVFTIEDFELYIVHYCIENELHYYKVDIEWNFRHYHLDNHFVHYNVRHWEYICRN